MPRKATTSTKYNCVAGITNEPMPTIGEGITNAFATVGFVSRIAVLTTAIMPTLIKLFFDWVKSSVREGK